MKKRILLTIDERLLEQMEKYRHLSGMNQQEFIRTAIWTMCIEMAVKQPITIENYKNLVKNIANDME